MSYYLLTAWLKNFEYRAEISWWIFALTFAISLVTTLLTVSYQSVKAAMMNPVKSLKSE
jgi:ABC-type antimicrobial peptide transport system permease subunit